VCDQRFPPHRGDDKRDITLCLPVISAMRAQIWLLDAVKSIDFEDNEMHKAVKKVLQWADAWCSACKSLCVIGTERTVNFSVGLSLGRQFG
jgi:hypothetical protein